METQATSLNHLQRQLSSNIKTTKYCILVVLSITMNFQCKMIDGCSFRGVLCLRRLIKLFPGNHLFSCCLFFKAHHGFIAMLFCVCVSVCLLTNISKSIYPKYFLRRTIFGRDRHSEPRMKWFDFERKSPRAKGGCDACKIWAQ